MIEIHDNAGTKSLGCFKNMKAAHTYLDHLKATGQIPAGEQSVTICHYTTGVLQHVSRVEHRDGKWRKAA